MTDRQSKRQTKREKDRQTDRQTDSQIKNGQKSSHILSRQVSSKHINQNKYVDVLN